MIRPYCYACNTYVTLPHTSIHTAELHYEDND